MVEEFPPTSSPEHASSWKNLPLFERRATRVTGNGGGISPLGGVLGALEAWLKQFSGTPSAYGGRISPQSEPEPLLWKEIPPTAGMPIVEGFPLSCLRFLRLVRFQ